MAEVQKKDISLSFFTEKDLKHPDLAKNLLKILYVQGYKFAPEKYDAGKRWEPIHSDNRNSLVEKWSHSNNILMRGDKEYKSEVAIHMGFAASADYNNIIIWVEESYFTSSNHINNFLEMSIAIYELLSPTYGQIHQTLDTIKMATVTDPKYGETIVPTNLRKGLPGVYWANFFGHHLVEKISKVALSRIPCERIGELDDGGILLVLTQSPLKPSNTTFRSRQKSAKDIIGNELFYQWEK